MERTLTFTIKKEEGEQTVISFLRKMRFSGAILQSMKACPAALLRNKEKCSGRTILQEGDRLTVRIPETKAQSALLPAPLPFGILYEDEDLLVADKPAGMPVHLSPGNYDNTLANALAWYQKQRGETYPFRCINRLDKDTTGALILAKNPYSASVLGDEMKHRRIHRTYLALVEGELPKEGVVEVPIGRCEDSVLMRMADPAGGASAVTRYRCLGFDGSLSLAELVLQTGRTHQIRVHMGYIGHPLPGDFLYHPDYTRISRQPLHSARLSFDHPVTRERLVLSSPLPEDIKAAYHGEINLPGTLTLL